MRSHSKTIVLGVAALFMAAVLPALAEVPKKKPLSRYAKLWNDSPFTVKPLPDVVIKEEENPLDNYTLAGACELKGGWFVVLMNKKDRERIRLRPGAESEDGFKVVKVEHGASYLETKVEIRTRSGKTGTVEYDKKFLVLKKATPKAPTGAKPGQLKPGQRPRSGAPTIPGRQPSGNRPPNPSSGGSTNKPRVRRIPNPPTR